MAKEQRIPLSIEADSPALADAILEMVAERWPGTIDGRVPLAALAICAVTWLEKIENPEGRRRAAKQLAASILTRSETPARVVSLD